MTLPFKPFDEQQPVRIYYNGFLPHWRQTGCTYFVTFRLADSIPQGVLDEWKYERSQWLAARGIDVHSAAWLAKFKQLPKPEQRLFERHFLSKLFDELDRGHGGCALADPAAAQRAMDAICHFHGERLDTGDVVIMPNHVHALMTPYDGFDLEKLLHSIKSYSASAINAYVNSQGKLWMKESHDHIVRDGCELVRIQEYIRENPAKAKLDRHRYLLRRAEYAIDF